MILIEPEHERIPLWRRMVQTRPAGNAVPNSTAVLIPLIISMVLVFLGVGVALAFYISYRRRYRRWIVGFRERRAREERERLEQEKKDSIGPGWWEVEVADDGDEEEEGYHQEKRTAGAQSDWNPVSVIYHHRQPQPDADPTPATHTPEPHPPEKVEMTVLIAMPSPSRPASRRTSPSSSMPSLDLTPSSTWRSSCSSSMGEDELPEVQLATVMLPVKQDYA